MKLIENDGYEIKVSDEAFLIRPIRELYEDDRTKRKELFFRQMSYLFFMVDPRSTYMYMTDENARAREIKLQEGFGEDWEPSPTLVEAMDIYRKHVTTTTSILLASMRKGIDNLSTFFSSVDLMATDDKGRPLYQVSSFTTALKQIPELSKAFFDAEKSLAKEFEDSNSQARGSREKSMYEDTI